MSHDEVIASLTLLFAVGHLDISYLIVHGIKLMAEQPEILAAYRDHVDRRGDIVNEILRLDTPEQFVARLTVEPISIAGVDIPAGEPLILFIGAGNRDPQVFPEPDTFDIDRDADLSKHLAFGGGVHGCAGQVLARAEADEVFTALVTRFARVEITGPSPTATQTSSARSRPCPSRSGDRERRPTPFFLTENDPETEHTMTTETVEAADLRPTPFAPRFPATAGEAIDIYGFAVPLWLTDPESEYDAIRNRVAALEFSMLFKWDVRGSDAVAVADAVFSRNLRDLGPNRIAYGVVVDETGHMLDDVTGIVLAEDHVRIIGGNPATAEALARWEPAGTPASPRSATPSPSSASRARTAGRCSSGSPTATCPTRRSRTTATTRPSPWPGSPPM